jgi:hypothetical protein
MRLIALLVLVLALAACGSGTPSTPTAAASALLSKAGATASGPAYMAVSGSTSNCATGAAEADGGIGNENVDVCVFASNGQLVSYINSGDYAAGAALIQVGQTTLIEVDLEDSYNAPPQVSCSPLPARSADPSITTATDPSISQSAHDVQLTRGLLSQEGSDHS